MSATTYIFDENQEVILDLPGYDTLNAFGEGEYEITYSQIFDIYRKLVTYKDEWCQKNAAAILSALNNMDEEQDYLVSTSY